MFFHLRVDGHVLENRTKQKNSYVLWLSFLKFLKQNLIHAIMQAVIFNIMCSKLSACPESEVEKQLF